MTAPQSRYYRNPVYGLAIAGLDLVVYSRRYITEQCTQRQIDPETLVWYDPADTNSRVEFIGNPAVLLPNPAPTTGRTDLPGYLYDTIIGIAPSAVTRAWWFNTPCTLQYFSWANEYNGELRYDLPVIPQDRTVPPFAAFYARVTGDPEVRTIIGDPPTQRSYIK
jgi:hypothetical protein